MCRPGNPGGRNRGAGPGSYACQVQVSDSQSSTLGSTLIQVLLGVRTVLTAQPSTLNLFTSGSPVNAPVNIGDLHNSNVPLDHQVSAPWLTVLQNSTSTPDTPRIVANPVNLSPGVYNGFVDFTSPLATNVARVIVNLTVGTETVITTNPSGLRVIVDDTPYPTPARFTWAPGTQHTLTVDPIIADGPTRYRFQKWAHGQQQFHAITAVAQGATYTVNFATDYQLQAVATAGGSISLTPTNTDALVSVRPAGAVHRNRLARLSLERLERRAVRHAAHGHDRHEWSALG